jgi:hypothetical protein
MGRVRLLGARSDPGAFPEDLSMTHQSDSRGVSTERLSLSAVYILSLVEIRVKQLDIDISPWKIVVNRAGKQDTFGYSVKEN